MMFSVLVEVSLREGVADPQGATIERSLPHLGFDGVRGVRVGKSIRFEVDAADEAAARAAPSSDASSSKRIDLPTRTPRTPSNPRWGRDRSMVAP